MERFNSKIIQRFELMSQRPAISKKKSCHRTRAGGAEASRLVAFEVVLLTKFCDPT